MTDKLVDDLRAESQVSQRTAWERADGGQDYAISAQLADAAADRIEALTAERDQLRADLAAAEARLAVVEAANRGLVRLNEATEARAEAAEARLAPIVALAERMKAEALARGPAGYYVDIGEAIDAILAAGGQP